MSFAPSTFHAGTGEDFFRKEGFLTGMAPIISARYTIPSFDGSDGTAVTITNSVAKAGSATAESWAGWNLGATYTKLLITAYGHTCPANGWGVGAKVDVLTDAAVIKPATYQTRFNIYTGHSLGKYTADPGSVFATIASDSTIYQKQEFQAAVWGIALYLDGTSNVQKTFIKSGTGQWIQVLSAGDTDHSSFQSVYFRHQGDDARLITPIRVWGS
tara:strand:- start:10915 stop:11559 length:645 start_codon:yes stop_codon:yes gene_type:complete